MSVAARLQHVNLLVECFLEAHNAQHLQGAWYESAIQQSLLQHLTCFCKAGLSGEHEQALMIKAADSTTVVPSSVEKVIVGGHVKADGDSVLVDVSPDLQAVVTRVAKGRRPAYKLVACQPLWVAVGRSMPAYTHPVLAHRLGVTAQSAVVLQRASCFRVGQHIFEVLQTPAVLPRHRNKVPVAPAVLPLPADAEVDLFDTVAAEIAASDTSHCVLQCVGPHHSPARFQLWTLPYNKGNVYFSVGTAPENAIVIPPLLDAGVRPHHCSVYALMGYFWLVDKSAAEGRWRTYVCQTPGSMPWSFNGTSGPQHMLVGGSNDPALEVAVMMHVGGGERKSWT